MPGASSLVIHQGARLDYDRLCTAIQYAVSGNSSSNIQLEALAELRACRAQVSSPLDSTTFRPPNPNDRSRISGLREVTIAIESEKSADASTIRLGADLISVAIALSDELHINELDAAVILFDARTRAAHRVDHDVVAAAKELIALRRREAVLFLQEVLRAGLLVPELDEDKGDSFLGLLLRERDILVVEHNVFSKLAERLKLATESLRSSVPGGVAKNVLLGGEFILFAEALFLIAYTTQLSRPDALMLHSLLELVDCEYEKHFRRERSLIRTNRGFGLGLGPNEEEKVATDFDALNLQMSPELVELESVRNLLLLTWACALDRSRYQDVYDPRTGQPGVNNLLKDLEFIPRTSKLPILSDDREDNMQHISKAMAAAEVCGAVFRLAVASPDEDEAVQAFLRVSAYAGALRFLSDDVASWIERRGGSLSPDSDLYADVLEDLALDLAEASQLVSAAVQFTQNDAQAASAEAAYASLGHVESSMSRAARRSSLPVSRGSIGHGYSGRYPAIADGANRNASNLAPDSQAANLTFPGRPPNPKTLRQSDRPHSARYSALRPPVPTDGTEHTHQHGSKNDDSGTYTPTENVVAEVAFFAARAVSLAPSKLRTDSIGGGLRYFVGIGQGNLGLVHRVGDAVIDLWDSAMRNLDTAGGAGDLFRAALSGFLALLSSISSKGASPSHAAMTLRYISEGGHSVVSLERASDAMSYFHGLLNSSSATHGAIFEEAEAEALRGIINLVANAAETLEGHGGLAMVIGDRVKDMSVRMASLVVTEVPYEMKNSLLHGLSALDHHRAISMYLETVATDKSAPLRRFLRSTESQIGKYDVSIRVLRLALQCAKWEADDVPEAALESIVTWFAVEEVLCNWSRRKYTVEAHRWQLMTTASDLVRAVVCRNPTSSTSFRILARFLTPAPGTGAAPPSLRSMVCAAGLMRTGDEKGFLTPDLSSHPGSQPGGSLFSIFGRDSLIHAAEHGLGDAYRAMQDAAHSASRTVTLVLSVPSGRISIPGTVVAPASELIQGEALAISSAASLVFVADGFIPAVFKAGYSSRSSAAVLEMLAKAALESYHVVNVLTRDPSGCSGSSVQFRSSLSNIISRAGGGPKLASNRSAIDRRNEETKDSVEVPIMHSALRIVEASLGVDGGGAPGMFLLGLQLDNSGRYVSAEYGVLGALVELVAGSHDSSGRVDNMNRSSAAMFLERLAANTVRTTSTSVLEHIKDVAGSDASVRGGGFADEMLFRILETAASFDADDATDVNWGSVGELTAACMSLSSLQVRLFPRYELDRCAGDVRIANSAARGPGSGRNLANDIMHSLPSPLNLLHLLSRIAASGENQVAFDGLCAWHHIVGTRLSVHETGMGYAAVPLLIETCSVLLDALAGEGNDQAMNALVEKDGGETAAAAVLLCVGRIVDCDRQELHPERLVQDIHLIALISNTIKALVGTAGIAANASRARTSLYAALLAGCKLSWISTSEDAVGRAFGGRLGQRQISGTEAVISAACSDAISGATTATKCSAMAVAATVAQLDPVRAIPTLGAQNRLRRVVHAALANPEMRTVISQGFSQQGEEDGSTSEGVGLSAAIAVVEAATTLIHAVSTTGHGVGIIADAGCIEALSSLLPSFDSQRILDYHLPITDESQKTLTDRNEDLRDGQPSHPRREKRLSLLATVVSAIAVSVCRAGSAVGDAAVLALEEGKAVFSDLLRNLDVPGSKELEAVGGLGLILSSVPQDVLLTASGCSQLRITLASVISSIIPPASNTLHIGGSGSSLSAGVNRRKPVNSMEVRRMKVLHPEGGSLYERDVIRARVTCLQNVLGALRAPDLALLLFSPQLTESRRFNSQLTDGGGHSGVAVGRLAEVLRICRVMLQEFQRFGDESTRIERRTGDTGSSLSSKRLGEISEYCKEEFGLSGDGLGGDDVMSCLRKTSATSQEIAETCMGVLEGGLLILREFIRVARDAIRGQVRRPGMDIAFGEKSISEEPAAMGLPAAEGLLADAKAIVAPLCKDIEKLQDGAWGRRDGSFAKQICRQIRTICTGRT